MAVVSDPVLERLLTIQSFLSKAIDAYRDGVTKCLGAQIQGKYLPPPESEQGFLDAYNMFGMSAKTFEAYMSNKLNSLKIKRV